MTEDQGYVVKQFLKGSDLFVSLSTRSMLLTTSWASWAVDVWSGSIVLVVSTLMALMKNQEGGPLSRSTEFALPCSN